MTCNEFKSQGKRVICLLGPSLDVVSKVMKLGNRQGHSVASCMLSFLPLEATCFPIIEALEDGRLIHCATSKTGLILFFLSLLVCSFAAVYPVKMPLSK